MEGEDFIFGKPCQVRVQVKALVNQVGEVATDQFAGWQAQPVLDIFTGLQHTQVGGIQHQQKAVRLDAAGTWIGSWAQRSMASASELSAVMIEKAPVMSVRVRHRCLARDEYDSP